MSLVLQIDSQDGAQVAPTFTLRPKPDRRRAPRVSVNPGLGLVCYINQEPEPAYVVGAQALERRDSHAVL